MKNTQKGQAGNLNEGANNQNTTGKSNTTSSTRSTTRSEDPNERSSAQRGSTSKLKDDKEDGMDNTARPGSKSGNSKK